MQVVKERRLPIKGKVLVQKGDAVTPVTPVARAEVPGLLETVRIDQVLGIEPTEVKERLLDRIDDDVRTSLGLVEETEYSRVFQRYVTHVVHWTRKEKVVNPTTGHHEDPDEKMMQEVEKTIGATGKKEDFRHDLISKIGAWSLDHPDKKPDFTEIFVDAFNRLRQAYYDSQKKTVSRGVEELIALLTDGEAALAKDARGRATHALGQLERRFGYQEQSARDLIRLLFRNRYVNRS